MIESALLATGAVVWIAIGITISLWTPIFVALAVGWVCYKREWLTTRDKILSFINWWTDNILKPVFDPIVN